MAQHPAIAPGRVAVITGAASGIGLAAARRFAELGMKICLADLEGEALGQDLGQQGAADGRVDDPRPRIACCFSRMRTRTLACRSTMPAS